MGVIRATAYPSRYAGAFNREWEENEAVGQERECAQLECVGKLYATARVRSPWFREADAQREIARTLGLAMNVKPLYTRNRGGSLYDRGWYDVGDWRICGKHVLTENFTLDTMPCVLKALEALGRRGFAPDGELALHFVPKQCNMEMVMNAYTILDARRELVEMALGLREEVQLVVDRDLAFSLPLDAFSIPAIEACACLLVQVCAMAASTRKARMKPCNMSNPKYQMRSWLLRLGFIGDQFARPRQTLLEHLDGNAAFFDDAGRQKAKEKRQRQKAVALA
ncbi:MAG: hypothetical protein ACLVJ8_17310 [Ruthenibacterium lactatiformans]